MANVFDKMKGGVPWGAITDGLASYLEQGLGAGEELLEQLRNWGPHLTRNALAKWSAYVVSQDGCTVPHLRDGELSKCDQVAVLRCDCCGRSACLAHARVDYLADGVCEVCIGELKAMKRGPQDFGRGRRAKASMSVEAAYRALGIEPGAPWAAVRRAYKRLAAKHNADRPQSDSQRARNTERLKQLNAAYAVLQKHFEAKAA